MLYVIGRIFHPDMPASPKFDSAKVPVTDENRVFLAFTPVYKSIKGLKIRFILDGTFINQNS